MTIKQEDLDLITKILETGQQLPSQFKDLLFPVEHKEYLLSYKDKLRKEDILSNLDGSFPCPLQTDKVFNESEENNDNWNNLIVFGDNLQFLKTIFENKDPLIKDKVKGKVKLIYIDPPFATEDEFKNKNGAKAYNDKKKGSEFVEFLRRRLILAKEILAQDGSIVVHLDWRKSHYIKVVMDEIFGENFFRNEIIWEYTGPGSPGMRQFNRKHDTLLWYSNSSKWTFNGDKVRIASEVHSGGFKGEIKKDLSNDYSAKGKIPEDWWIDCDYHEEGIIIKEAVSSRIKIDGIRRTGYPTEKPLKLLKRIIESMTNEGDIVFDFFGGSGTTAFVSELLGRKWISCDIGKLAYYTLQSRLLKIQSSPLIDNTKLIYNKKAKKFITASLGIYDLQKTFNLEWGNYKSFVANLFDFKLDKKSLNGILFDGLKENSYVHIFDFKKLKNSIIDESYLNNLHSNIGNKTNGKVYIVSPINYVDFISDYLEIDDVKYYFLKVPYHVIKELHKIPFERSKQPKNKNSVNDLDYAIGFHFIIPPVVQSSWEIVDQKIIVHINKFESSEETEIKGFNSLSSIFVCKDYADDFILTDVLFYDDIEKNGIFSFEINLKEAGSIIKIIYTDIFGNEFTEIKNKKDIL